MPRLRTFVPMLLALIPGPLASFPPDRLAAIDDAIGQAITDARTPGAVLFLDHQGDSYVKAYGNRAILPALEAMTVDTLFDTASLTKVVATATAVMILAERGEIDLESPLSRHLPEFTGNGRQAITPRQLLTHTSGLRAGLSTRDWLGPDGALKAACAEVPVDPPGTAYRYSDVNFILLGLLIEKVSGRSLDRFCAEEIFAPLAMKDTGFRPFDPHHTPASTDDPRIAPTTLMPDGSALRGVVHDPTARRMGGVAGHAGVFSTASDLGRFARTMLDGGELDGIRILKSATVRAMTTVQSPPGLPRRGLGWDIDSPYAGPRGDRFPIGSFGHTGWTGTRIWIDPFSRTTVILLSNRNHPDEKGDVIALQRQLGNLAARAIPDFDFTRVDGALKPESPPPVAAPPAPATGPVLTGIDVLKRDDFRQLRGRRVGLITNHSGIDRLRNPSIDLLHRAPDLELVALFSPEHGIRGDTEKSEIDDETDPATGLPVFSLYGKHRSPTPGQLAGIDTLVFDIQDVGCRFYTYISTMTRSMEAAAAHRLRFVVLDRPNPIGATVEGPVLSGERGFVAVHEIPLRHGMTVGELARQINAERGLGADLGVIRCEGGSPLQWFDATAQPWTDPSPNLRSLTAATLYPGVGLLEFCRLSVGRGTDTPFEILGAPYIDDLVLAAGLNQAGLPGVRFVPIRFTPDSSVFAGERCQGVRILLTDRDAFRASDLGVVLATTLHRLHGDLLELQQMKPLLGDDATLDALLEGGSLPAVRAIRDRGIESFLERRRPHLLYPR